MGGWRGPEGPNVLKNMGVVRAVVFRSWRFVMVAHIRCESSLAFLMWYLVVMVSSSSSSSYDEMHRWWLGAPHLLGVMIHAFAGMDMMGTMQRRRYTTSRACYQMHQQIENTSSHLASEGETSAREHTTHAVSFRFRRRQLVVASDAISVGTMTFCLFYNDLDSVGGFEITISILVAVLAVAREAASTLRDGPAWLPKGKSLTSLSRGVFVVGVGIRVEASVAPDRPSKGLLVVSLVGKHAPRVTRVVRSQSEIAA